MLLENSTSKRVALGGLLISLNMVILAMINIIPINTVFLMGLSSLTISVVIIEFGLKMGVMFYIASSVLSFFIISSKFQWITYVMTFCIYGIIKYVAEKNNNIYVEYIIKISLSNILILALCGALRMFVAIPINVFTILLFQVILLVYDRAYTSFIILYKHKLRKII